MEIITSLLVIIGGVFVLVGSYGLVRLPDFYTRLHAPTKATTLGLAGLLTAFIVHSASIGQFGLGEVLITAFLFITAPVSAFLLARTGIQRRLPSIVPLPETDESKND